MQLKFLSACFLAVPTMMSLNLAAPRPAMAFCLMADIALQTQISGTSTPGHQENNVNMAADGPCWGNTTTNVQTQTYVGTGDANQIRNSNHFVSSGGETPFGIDIPPVTTSIHVPIDIYSPAHDEDFMNSLGM